VYSSLVLTTQPSAEPVTLAEAKAACNWEHTSADDTKITGFIVAAREQVENYTETTRIDRFKAIQQSAP
jgi:hypothetical protein